MTCFIGLFAHGADPTPLAWDTALANLIKFFVSFLFVGVVMHPILQPIFSSDSSPDDSEATLSQADSESSNSHSNDAIGWLLLGLTLVLAVGWWLVRTSLVEVNTKESLRAEEHAHGQSEGGQVAMWGDFHAEVVRVESGELRIYLRDSYNRDISSKFFQATVQVINVESREDNEEYEKTSEALNGSFRFIRLPLTARHYRVKVSTSGWSSRLKFSFDESQGKRSLPTWCSSPAN